ncbi:HvfC/BufC family peptide modification chaperone [Planctobacterium marinum]|uniref:HvfC/BufC family peptide modification chaperone n=1 Tax=Planctobacterium marinum TaxID=1631968 RepID=UPI001E56D448|nr:putative DNA-binding domain-containing protein [Planctobacterium marinum]MCC2606520.1 DNA-binding domain-containing protein [Planctobacterium marinum]
MTNLTSSVSDYQTQLLQDIFGVENTASIEPRALQIYQDNVLLTAARSLSLTYPVLDKMIGSDALLVLSRRLLKTELPDSGDWADWGSQLHSLLEQSELRSEYPYLQDIARLEWLVSQASRSPATPFVAESLSQLEQPDLSQVFMQLSPSLSLLESEYPVLPMWQAHQNLAKGQELPGSALAAIAEMGRQNNYCVVVQTPVRPDIHSLDAAEFQWLRGITAGLSVSALLDTYPGVDFVKWLSIAIEKHWLLRFC